jgi:hypothetical protein
MDGIVDLRYLQPSVLAQLCLTCSIAGCYSHIAQQGSEVVLLVRRLLIDEGAQAAVPPPVITF